MDNVLDKIGNSILYKLGLYWAMFIIFAVWFEMDHQYYSGCTDPYPLFQVVNRPWTIYFAQMGHVNYRLSVTGRTTTH